LIWIGVTSNCMGITRKNPLSSLSARCLAVPVAWVINRIRYSRSVGEAARAPG
jgi:hypothetical protein